MVAKSSWIGQEQFERETSTKAAFYWWLALKTAANRFGHDFEFQIIYWAVRFWALCLVLSAMLWPGPCRRR